MKSRILILATLILGIIFSPLWVGAESGATSSGGTINQSGGTTKDENALLLDEIIVADDLHITMNFSQNIVVDSVRLRIAKQSDGTNIKVESLTGVLDEPKHVYITLSDLLEAGETYTVTVISALSDKGVTITEGTDALSEFKAPDPLKESLVVFDAAPNPQATVVTPPTTEDSEEISGSQDSEDTSSVETAAETIPVPENAELPLTGMNPIIFIFISGILAFFLILRKKS